jgi:hypothetical protein
MRTSLDDKIDSVRRDKRKTGAKTTADVEAPAIGEEEKIEEEEEEGEGEEKEGEGEEKEEEEEEENSKVMTKVDKGGFHDQADAARIVIKEGR